MSRPLSAIRWGQHRVAGKEEAIQKLKKWWATKADVQMYRTALTGDGSNASTCDVTGHDGWAWVRYDEKQDKASMVVNQVMPGAPQGVPVIIGKKYPHDKYYQILGVNMELYYEHTSPTEYISYLLPLHGSTHTWGNSDPAWIDVGNLLPGAVSATSPVSMFVTANSLLYEYRGSGQTLGASTIDLTTHIPGVAGTHWYTLISIDPDLNALEATDGAAVPIPMMPGIPAIPLQHVPLAVIMMVNGMTTIVQTDIFQYKFLFGPSSYIYWINQIVAQADAEWDYDFTRHAL